MKNLIAFVLACFAVALAFTIFGAVLLAVAAVPMSEHPQSTTVEVRSPQDTASTVAAINALNLPHVRVHGHSTAPTISSYIVAPFEMTLSLFISSGVVFVIFKRICRRMGIEPIV